MAKLVAVKPTRAIMRAVGLYVRRALTPLPYRRLTPVGTHQHQRRKRRARRA